MAEPLFIVRNSAGEVVIDSRTAVAGACVDLIEIAAGAAAVLTYPAFAGFTPMVLQSGFQSMALMPAADSDLGYPRLTFASFSAAARQYAIFML